MEKENTKNKISDKEVEEVTFDYTVQNNGKTHMLIVEFPEFCDEECFLITLKAYLRAQNENLQRLYGNQQPN